MATNKLSDVKLRSLLKAEIDKAVSFSDGQGLSVRVTPSQRKVASDEKRFPNNILWLYRYRNPYKSPNPLSLVLGKYPDLSLSDARQRLQQCRTWLANKQDPKEQFAIDAERSLSAGKAIDVITVRDAIEYWINGYAKENRANVDKHISQLDKHVFPTIGHLPVEQCDTQTWVRCFDAIRKTAPVSAGYILQMCKQALKFCRVRHFAFSNALEDLTTPDIGKRQQKRDRVLTDVEVCDLWSRMDEQLYMVYYERLLRLLVCFGCRTQEIRLSRWEEWDLSNWRWTVPKSHSKTKQAIIRPIPERLRKWIADLHHETSKSGIVLGEIKNTEAVSQWGRNVYARLEHREPWTLHDIRRTFATKLNDLGVAPHVVEQLLGHALPGVMAIYNRSQYLTEKETALNIWLEWLYERSKKYDK